MKSLARCLAAAVSALLLAGDVAAATPDVTPDGWRYLLGSTAAQDEAVLQVHEHQYSLLVMTAGRRSHAALTGVRMRVLDGGQTAPFDRVLPGTWLLLDLPAGRYEIDATCRGQQQRQPVVMSAGDHQAMVFYFDETGDDPAD